MEPSEPTLGPFRTVSEDLRKKIADAVERGMKKSEVARSFGVGLSTVKRYISMLKESDSLAPKKTPGKRPKTDEPTCSRHYERLTIV